MSHGIEACVLCGSETRDRAMATVEWTEPVGKVIWSHIPRCLDRAACRETVELTLHEPWPINDRTPAPERVARPPDEPVAAVEVPTADVQEAEIAWLK